MNKTFVFVSGGTVTAVTNQAGEPVPEIVVIDWDVVPNGACPVCGNDIEADQPTCPRCGYDTDLEDTEEAIRCAVAIDAGW